MINESQDLPVVGDELSTEPSTSQTQPGSSINTVEPQTWREPTGKLMEDGSSQENEQGMPESSLTDKGEEFQTQSELRSELTEDETLQEPTQVAEVRYIEGSRKTSYESQSMDYEFLENSLDRQSRENDNVQESPEEITIY